MSRPQTFAPGDSFALGDRVRPTSGPYRRTEFIVVGTKGDRIQVESENLRLAFPAKLLSIAPVERSRGASENELPPKTKTDEVITDEVGANPPTPELIQKVLGRMANSMRPDNSHIPINKNGHVLSVGDRVAGAWDETITGIVEAIHPSGRVFVRYSESVAIEFFESALILVPPKKDLGMDEPKPATSPAIPTPENTETTETSLPILSIDAEFKVGDLVTFTQSWWGEDREFEGTAIALNHPPGTAIVRYRAPDVARELEIKAPIGVFALRKVDCPELSLLHEALGEVPPEKTFSSGGTVAPPGCWIERKVHSGGWAEAVFKARTAIFPAKRGGGMAKSRYIGKWGSPAHSAAIEAVKRRNEAQKQKS